MKAKSVVGIIYILVEIGTVTAQTQWTQTSGPVGGRINDIFYDQETCFAATVDCGVFRMHHLNTSWQFIPSAFQTTSIYSFCKNDSGLFVSTDYGIYRSLDNGVNWIGCGLTGTTVYSLVSANSGDIFVSTDQCVNYRSPDGGTTWEEITDGLAGVFIRSFHSTSWDTLFALGGSCIYRSSGEGKVWRPLNGPNDVSTFETLVTDSSCNIYIITNLGPFRSRNNGETWEAIGSGLQGSHLTALTVNGDAHLYAVGFQGVYRFLNSGDHWTRIRGPFSDRPIYVLRSAGSETLLAGSYGQGIFYSSDGGMTWGTMNTGLTATRIRSLTVCADTVLLAGTCYSGIYRSTDRGDTWLPIDPNLNMWMIGDLFHDGEGNLFAGLSDPGKIFRSTDGGLTWESVSGTLPNLSIYAFAIDPQGNLIAGTREGLLYRSPDHGDSWLEPDSGLVGQHIMALTVNSEGLMLAGTNGGGLFESADSGITWMNVPLQPYSDYITALAMVNDSVFLAAAEFSGLYRIEKNGTDWTISRILYQHISSVMVNSKGQAFAGGSEFIIYSEDGGLSWNDISDGYSGSWVVDMVTDGAENLYAGTEIGGVLRRSEIISNIPSSDNTMPQHWQLRQNYPNPFNAGTTFQFTLYKPAKARLVLYDTLGRQVTVIRDQFFSAGSHRIPWEGTSMPSGLYFVRLILGAETQTIKAALIK